MNTPITMTLVAGMSIAGVGAASAETDPCVWRYYVNVALLAQQNETTLPLLIQEVRASASEASRGLPRPHERFVDGLPAAAGDAGRR